VTLADHSYPTNGWQLLSSESGHTHIQHPLTCCRHRLCLRTVCARPHLPRPARKTNPVWSRWPCRLSSSARFFNLRSADPEMRRTVAADAGQTRHDPARAGRHDPCMAEKPCKEGDSGVIATVRAGAVCVVAPHQDHLSLSSGDVVMPQLEYLTNAHPSLANRCTTLSPRKRIPTRMNHEGFHIPCRKGTFANSKLVLQQVWRII
jgi:hypothetical protein